MIRPVVPESFRERPYASTHFQAIAAWAAEHHPFYMKRVSGEAPEFPVLTRRDVQEDNALLLNGHAATAKTSGSIATPVSVAWSRQRARMDRSDPSQIARTVAPIGAALYLAESSVGSTCIF